MDQRNRGPRVRARVARRGAPRKATSAARALPNAFDVPGLLGRFSDALSLLAVVQRSLAMQEFAGVGDEEVSLRRAIDELKAVYEELDSASPGLQSAAAARLAAREPDDYK